VVDSLVLNAGCLSNELQRTQEGLEVTFSCHVLNGVFSMVNLFKNNLVRSTLPTILIVSSGGM